MIPTQEEILDKWKEVFDGEPNSIFILFKWYAEKVIDECAKNAEISYEKVLFDDPKEGDDAYFKHPIVNKNSILKLKEQL